MYPMLKQVMKKAGMTQEELAAKIGVSPVTLSYKLSGKSPLKLIEAVAIKRALGSEMLLEELFFCGG